MSEKKCLLLAWGANSYGQLGTGDCHDEVRPKPLGVSFDGSPLKQIVGGGGHTIFLCSDGRLFSCGWNKHGQCGISLADTPSPEVLSPQPLIPQPGKVQKVACGWNHTLAVIEGGVVVSWGCNAFGQLGVPTVEKQSIEPVKLARECFQSCQVTDIGAGLRHSIAITESGAVFSWGDGKKGQLGLGSKELALQRQPKHVCALSERGERCTSVCAGAYHSTAITAKGDLYSWGLNQHGQCALSVMTEKLEQLGKENFKVTATGHVTHVYTPVKVEGVVFVKEAHCGWSHTLAIAGEAREAWGWGRADYGQLGHKVVQENHDVIDDNKTKLKESHGHFSSVHESVLSSQDKQSEQETFQAKLHGQAIQQLGQEAVHLGQDSNKGNSSVGDHMPRKQHWCHTPRKIPQLKGVKQIACGSEHNLAVTDSGKLLAFGWNEHGMCATGTCEDVFTPTPVLLDAEHRNYVTFLVGAGAGHSLALVNYDA